MSNPTPRRQIFTGSDVDYLGQGPVSTTLERLRDRQPVGKPEPEVLHHAGLLAFGEDGTRRLRTCRALASASGRTMSAD